MNGAIPSVGRYMYLESATPTMRVTELGLSFPADMSLCVYVREQALLIPEVAQHGPAYILYTC